MSPFFVLVKSLERVMAILEWFDEWLLLHGVVVL